MELTNLSSLSFLVNSIVAKRRLPKDSFDGFVEQRLVALVRDSL